MSLGWNKSLKHIQENTIKQVKEINKTVQNLKVEINAIKKTQAERTQEIKILKNWKGATESNFNNRIQEMEEF